MPNFGLIKTIVASWLLHKFNTALTVFLRIQLLELNQRLFLNPIYSSSDPLAIVSDCSRLDLSPAVIENLIFVFILVASCSE